MIKLESIFVERFNLSKKRMDICMTCDKLNKKNKRCSACGCFMDYKTMLHDVSCPLGKWQAEEVLNSPSDQETQ